MIRFQAWTASAVMAVLLVSGAAFAQGPRPSTPLGAGGGGRAGGGGGLAGLPLAGLNLTETQQDLIRGIRDRHQAEMQNEILAVLSPEQQAQVKSLQAERGARRGQAGRPRGRGKDEPQPRP
jgi:Spy/CpxP family protein refolding chaperone